jgi:UDP-N-acetylmuramate--alanine ligase
MNEAHHTKKNGVMEYWNNGIIEGWNNGLMDEWIGGKLLSMTQHSGTPALRHSLPPSVHFVGIGGTGMNGVAQLARHAGCTVTGSDRATGLRDERGQYDETCRSEANDTFHGLTPEWSIFQVLENSGITLFPQDGSGITDETDLVVYSTAIEESNPDLTKARKLGIPRLHRAEMLAKLCEGNDLIAVAGSAGKSTVTGLLGHIFESLGLDPTVYCGAPVLNWKNDNVAEASSLCNQRQGCRCHSLGNVRFGRGPWIIEADESDRSFLHFHPKHAIITNISEDHFELAELRKLFAQFESQVSGIVINEANGVSTNILNNPDYQNIGLTPEQIPLLGKHNIENINNALTLCKALGLDMDKCSNAVATFKGVERRLERVGKRVFDDFAHSPAKIEAAFTAVAGQYDRVLAYWRPHGFGPLAQHADALRRLLPHLLRPADKFFVLPVYYAGGTVEKKLTAEQFCAGLDVVEFIPDYDALETRLLEITGNGGTAASPSMGIEADAPPVENFAILGMGARDPELPRFAQQIAKKLI